MASVSRRQASYNALADNLAAIGITETEPNLRNKLSTGALRGAFRPMPNRPRLLHVALGGLIAAVLLCGNALAVDEAAQANVQGDRAAHERGKGGGSYQAAPTASTVKRPPPRPEERPKPPENGVDLSAPWTWSFAKKLLTDPIAVLTLFLLIVGYWQLHISRDATRRQLRAYVFLDSCFIGDGRTSKPQRPDRIDVPSSVLMMKNTGQTPAYDVFHWSEIDVLPVEQEDQLVVPKFVKPESKTYIAAGTSVAKVRHLSRKITAEEKASLIDGRAAIYIFGRIEYRDAFRRRHATAYRLRYTGDYPPPETPLLNFCDKGNEADQDV